MTIGRGTGYHGAPPEWATEKPFSNELTDAQLERLAILAEELGEAQQVIGKILRHGYMSGNPLEAYVANQTLLEKELGHVKFAIGMLCFRGDISESEVIASCDKKGETIKRWLHHQKFGRVPQGEREAGG